MSVFDFLTNFISDQSIKVSIIDCSMSWPIFHRGSVRKLLNQQSIGGVSLSDILVSFIEPADSDCINIWIELY